jgi:FkbM family methyltransferase
MPFGLEGVEIMFQISNQRHVIIEKAIKVMGNFKESSVYIMGRNEYCDHLIKGFQEMDLDLVGIIDDYTDLDQYHGYPIEKSRSVPLNSIIVSCVITGKLISAIDRLKQEGHSRILTYFDIWLLYPDKFPAVQFCENNFNDINSNGSKYNWLFDQLNDDNSRETLTRLIDFRYNFNVDVMRYFSFRIHEQYFDQITWIDNEIFVDCGCFDGQTTLRFIELNPKYLAAYAFEPSPINYEASSKALDKIDRVKLYPYATFRENDFVSFDANQGSASGISHSGQVTVKTVKLDDMISEATYIKMDVEGAEYDTLLGAKRLIQTCKPKLAICVYHNQEDFWRIPELVLSYNPDYKVRLTHYSEGIFETVMYFF